MIAEEKVKKSETSLIHLREDVALLANELNRRDPRKYHREHLAPTTPVDPTSSDDAPVRDDAVNKNAIRQSLNADVKDYLNRALQVYRRKECTSGRITSEDDFKYVWRRCSSKITGKILNKLKENTLSRKGMSLATEYWYVFYI